MTPTTKEIRHDYARGFADGEDDIQLREWRFDKWLAEHDRQTAAHPEQAQVEPDTPEPTPPTDGQPGRWRRILADTIIMLAVWLLARIIAKREHTGRKHQ